MTTEILLERRRNLLEQAGEIDRELQRVGAPDLETILILVAKNFGVTTDQIRSRQRPVWIVDARFAWYHLARQQTTYSMSYLGRWLDYRDHGTLLHGLRGAQARLETDPKYRARVEKIARELTDLGITSTRESATAHEFESNGVRRSFDGFATKPAMVLGRVMSSFRASRRSGGIAQHGEDDRIKENLVSGKIENGSLRLERPEA